MSLLALTLLAGCNSYELFRVTGYEQASFSNDADILFIIDNSQSMAEESTALASNFDRFVGKLTNTEGGSNVPTVTLADAVDNYIRETAGGELFIDYQLAITTSSVYYDDGASPEIEPGEAGTLAYDSASDVPSVIGRGASDSALAFQTNLLCEATCWESSMPSNPDYVCGDPLEGDISEDYLDCLCGVDEWKNHCGTGQEQGLEAAYMALCRATDSPPDDCYTFPEGSAQAFQSGDEGSNAGLLREGARTLIVMVTDEGDGSLRKDGTEEPAVPGDVDEVVEEYVDLFEDMPNIVRFAVIGPNWDGTNGLCLDSAQTWGVERYQGIVEATNGLYIPITDSDAACTPADFGTSLEQLGELLSNLLTFFPLQSVPDVASIEAYVDGELVEQAELVDDEYVDGWSYDASENAVSFHGSAVPDYNQDVRIFYRPLGGTPRELPF